MAAAESQTSEEVKQSADKTYEEDFFKLRRFIHFGHPYCYYKNQHMSFGKNYQEKCGFLDDLYGSGLLHQILLEIETHIKDAPSHQPSMYLLAALLKVVNNDKDRHKVYEMFVTVAKTSEHLFDFLAFNDRLNAHRTAWGSGHRRAVKRWYDLRTNEELLDDICWHSKGSTWSHHDVIRLAHIIPKDPKQSLIMCYAAKSLSKAKEFVEQMKEGEGAGGIREELKALLHKLDECKRFKTASVEDLPFLAKKIEECDRTIPMNQVPSSLYSKREIWSAAIPKIPLLFLLKNLGRLTQAGMLSGQDEVDTLVKERLSPDSIGESQLTPLSFMIASRAYELAKQNKWTHSRATKKKAGPLPPRDKINKKVWETSKKPSAWQPLDSVQKLLDDAVPLSLLKNSTPTGLKLLISIDTSISMREGRVWGCGKITLRPIEVASLLALSFYEGEQLNEKQDKGRVKIFLNGNPARFVDDKELVTEGDKLPALTKRIYTMNGLLFQPSCSVRPIDAAINVAMEEKIMDRDAFILITDNDMYSTKFKKNLEQYRKESKNPNVRVVCIALCSSDSHSAMSEDVRVFDLHGVHNRTLHIIHKFLRAEI